MVIRPKHLAIGAVAVAALFVIAAPIGDNHHGLGKHSALLATVGQTIFVTFLVSVVALIVATLVAIAQSVRSSRQNRGIEC